MQAGNTSAPTKLPRAAALLMAASNKQYHWPTGYVKGSSQAIRSYHAYAHITDYHAYAHITDP